MTGEDEEDIELASMFGGQCEHGFCHAPGVAHNEDGQFLCEDHLEEWVERLLAQLCYPQLEEEDDEADPGYLAT